MPVGLENMVLRIDPDAQSKWVDIDHFICDHLLQKRRVGNASSLHAGTIYQPVERQTDLTRLTSFTVGQERPLLRPGNTLYETSVNFDHILLQQSSEDLMHLRRDPVPVNIPPGKGMAKEPRPLRFIQGLPELLGLWTQTIHDSTPLRARSYMASKIGQDLTNFAAAWIELRVYRGNRRCAVAMRDKASAGDHMDLSAMPHIPQRQNLIDHRQAGPQDTDRVIGLNSGEPVKTPWVSDDAAQQRHIGLSS